MKSCWLHGVMLMSMGLQAGAIGEGVLDVDALLGMFTGVANMFTNLPTVDIHTNKIMGRWFQMYKAAINFDVFRTQMFCPVAYFVIIKAEPPVDQANDTHDYFIATDSNRLALMVFARDPVQFYNEYNDEVLGFLKEKGFGGQVFWNAPKAIYQGSDCQWPSEKEVFARRVLKNHQKKGIPVQFQRQGPVANLNPVQALQGIFSRTLNGKK